MKRFSVSLNTNTRLALVAGTLGLLAIAGGSPGGGHTVTVDTKQLAMIVQTEVDHITPVTLAEWIILGRNDYRLLDLRTREEFAEYHIPSAENVEVASLPDYGLLRNEKIVLYSEGGIHAAQAWMLLKAKGYKGVTMLLGGLDGWRDEVLFPSIQDGAGPDRIVEFEKRREMSRFFGGTPRTGVIPGDQRAVFDMPKIKVPAPSSPVAGPRKKKKEGC
jgi:rhodanese-related sulfurtransferase